MGKSNIDYCDQTLNVVAGCEKVGSPCRNCWAVGSVHRIAGQHERFAGLVHETDAGLEWTGAVRAFPQVLDQLSSTKRPQVWLCSALGDLFHQDVPPQFVNQVLQAAAAAPRHRILFLTKRPRAMGAFVAMTWPGERAPDHLWFGASVWDQDSADNALDALATLSGHRWLSYEPALGPVDFFRSGLVGVSWVVMGCESGPKRRNPPHPPCEGAGCHGCRETGHAVWSWAVQAHAACNLARVPYYLKQLPIGGHVEKLPVLDGQRHLQKPASLIFGSE